MLDFTQGSSLQTIKTVLLTTVLLGTAQLLAGCDSRPANSNENKNDNVAAQTDNIDKIYGVEKIFRRTKVDEKVLRLIQKHNQIGQDYLKEINLPEEDKTPFIELANYLLRRES